MQNWLTMAGLLAALLTAPSLRADEWETVVEGDALSVWQRPYGDSPLMELRGRTRVTASLNAIMALLKDADYNRHWVFRSGGASILEAPDYARAYVHGIIDAPWPMQDRDAVVRFDFAQHPQTLVITITITNFPDFMPQQAGFVRVPDFGGFWQLSPLPGGQVEVVYQVHGNPGGWVPTWLANYAAELSVTNTLRNMPAALEHYTDARSNEVLEMAYPRQ